ncbi:MAG: mechanosensitive ion channel [Verrucomicrobiota bacterium]|nr:mechanosensitive ion channel [Verrucomicrobiota bacterium]
MKEAILQAFDQLNEALFWLGNNTNQRLWVNFFITILIGIILGQIVHYLFRKWAERLKRKNPHTWAIDVVSHARMPIQLFIFAYFLSIGVDILKLPGWLWLRVHETIFPLIYGTTFIIFFLSLVDIMAIVIKRWLRRSNTEVDEHIVNLFRRVCKFLVILVAIAIAVEVVYKKEIWTLIAGLSFAGAAIALAAQSTIANIFASVAIIADRIFRVGDRIQFEDKDGFVVDMGLRSMKIRALSGEVITIPNKDVADRQVRNLTRDGASAIHIVVGLTYDTSRADVEKAINILNEVFAAQPEVRSHTVVFNQLGAYSLNISCFLMADYHVAPEYHKILSAVLLQIKERFDVAKINFAFPTQTLHLPIINLGPSGK